jgi:CubicO group peptidase (beta-lactamase class C family)
MKHRLLTSDIEHILQAPEIKNRIRNPNLLAPLSDEIAAATPSLWVSVFARRKKRFEDQWGDVHPFYDWASLTKVTFTTSLFMALESDGVFNVNTRVQDVLPWFPWANIRVRDLLCHNAGFVWWQPFFKSLDLDLSVSLRWEQLKAELIKTNPKKQAQAVYSDIDFLLLKYVLEAVTQKPLEVLLENYRERLGLGQAHFNINNQPQFKLKNYAPTEKCPWRKKVLRGQVHDENTWALGGVAAHAGLFGQMQDLASWALALRAGQFASDAVQKKFFARQMPATRGDWALGFMMPTKGKASCGQYFSPTSVGHTGFTGTSFWWDLKRDVMVLILANRIHPTRDNKKFVELRPKIHDLLRDV